MRCYNCNSLVIDTYVPHLTGNLAESKPYCLCQDSARVYMNQSMSVKNVALILIDLQNSFITGRWMRLTQFEFLQLDIINNVITVTFFSRSLKCEQYHSSVEKEDAAIVQSVHK
ncbi:Hypothetical predicted protein [Octopus vulgaris]|uniref:Uncharacterized protein n=1 Tax=Octopus vulgaris TaxID=6645 RepID=A0AA36ALY0_OCTVU|nr:Hypothetical predicted protein [Octopus vulgaris]